MFLPESNLGKERRSRTEALALHRDGGLEVLRCDTLSLGRVVLRWIRVGFKSSETWALLRWSFVLGFWHQCLQALVHSWRGSLSCKESLQSVTSHGGVYVHVYIFVYIYIYTMQGTESGRPKG